MFCMINVQLCVISFKCFNKITFCIYYLFLDKLLSSKWPSNGSILFKNFYLRYGSKAPYAINNLNVHIESMQKVTLLIIYLQYKIHYWNLNILLIDRNRW